jgi:hypothetical protein
LESKNFKENLDDLLNKYLKYTEENVKKKYKTNFLDYYSRSLIILKYQLEVTRNLDLIDKNAKKHEIQKLINQIEFAENRIGFLNSDSFFLDSFIFQEANVVIPNNMNLLFLLLISFISSLLLSIFVISIRYCLIK